MPIPPEYPGVYIEELSGPQAIDGVPTSVTGFAGYVSGGALNEPIRLSSFLDFEREYGGLDSTSELSYAVQQYFLNGGSEAWVVGTPSPDAPDLMASLAALDGIDVLNLLCVPDTMNLSDGDAAQVMSATQSYCEQRRAFFLVDVPQRDAPRTTPEQMKNWIEAYSSLRNNNSAVFYPRPQVADLLNLPALRTVASSGTIAGLLARHDMERGVWKAAAGSDAYLRGVEGFEYRLNEAETAELNQLGINCLRTFPEVGSVCWGARTLVDTRQEDPEWKYIPVRRTMLFLEESLLRGTKQLVFEPDQEKLWTQVRLNVARFLFQMFHMGMFAGRTPDEAFFVKCDRTTMTQDDIDNGRLIVEIGVAPLKPAEFVIFRLQQHYCADCT